MSIKVATHNGVFHADELMAVAVLSLLHSDQEIKVVRTRDRAEIEAADLVVDVGGRYEPEAGRFDHHQKDGAGVRSNGVPYASFGLVWRHYGSELAGGISEAEAVDQRLVQPIDAGDNGLSLYKTVIDGLAPYKIQDLFLAWQPLNSDNSSDYDQAFDQALVFGKQVIQREIELAQHMVYSSERVKQAYEAAEDKRLIVLEERWPWRDALLQFAEPLYVVAPRVEGEKWGVKAVPKDKFSFELRRPLPEAWAAKRDQELSRVTGVEGAIFCHRNRFLCVADSKSAALALARKALQN